MRCLEYVFYTLTEQIQSHIYSPGDNQIWIYDDVTHICKMAPTPRNTRRSPPGSLLRLEVLFPHTTLRVLMRVPNSQLTTIFSVKYRLTAIFLANSQLTTYFRLLLTFTFLQRILFRHNPKFPSFSKSITFWGRPY